MIDEEISNLTVIDALIRKKRPFVVYRIPGEKLPRLLTQAEEEIRLIYDLQELNGQKGFVIAPFRVSEMCPVVLIQSDGWGQSLSLDDDTEEEYEASLQIQEQENFQTSYTKEYADCFKHLSMPYVTGLLTSWYFPGVLRWIRGRTFLFHPYFVRPASVIFIHIYTYVTLPRPAFGWEVLPKLFYRVRKMNGIRLHWPEHSLCRMANCRKYGMKKQERAGLRNCLYP